MYSVIADHGMGELPKYQPNPVFWPNDAQRIGELERKVASLEELLRKAKIYDEQTGQPECELDEKKDALRRIAKQLGVEINLP